MGEKDIWARLVYRNMLSRRMVTGQVDDDRESNLQALYTTTIWNWQSSTKTHHDIIQILQMVIKFICLPIHIQL